MKKNKLILIIIFVFLAGWLAFYFYYNYEDAGRGELSNNTGGDINKLVTREDPTKPEANIIPAGSVAYEVEVAQSQVVWAAGKIVGDPLTGTVGILSGSLWLDKLGDLAGGKFIIDMEDISSTNLPTADLKKNLVDHLKSDDFFSVSNYPTAQFKITSVEKKSENSYLLTGDLTIRGQTHPISFPAIINISPTEINAQAEFSIDRTVWGIKYGSGKFYQDLGDKTIKDDIGFSVKIKAKRLSNN